MRILKKKMTFIAWLFWKLLTPKNVVTWRPESSCLRTPCGYQGVNGSQTLLKPAGQNFYPKFPLDSDKLSSKTSALVISVILGLFFNMLTAYHMYSSKNLDKFKQQIQMQLSSKPLTFSKIFIAFFNFT